MLHFKRKKLSGIQKLFFNRIERKKDLLFTIALLAGGTTNVFSADTVATLIKTTDTSAFNPASPDPSGITYLESTGKLLICDGEVNEMTDPINDLFTGDNLFEMSLTGDLTGTSTTVKTAPNGFSNEPTGVSRVNPNNQHIFFTDDDDHLVFEIAPGTDGKYGTDDDVTIASIDTHTFPTVERIIEGETVFLSSNDPEGIAYAPELGDLFVADGTTHEIYRVSPGINGVFDGVSPAGDDIVTHFNLIDPAIGGLTNLEGIEYDSATGHLLAIGEPENVLFEMSTSGVLVQTIDVSSAAESSDTFKPAGLAIGPSSDNADNVSIYIADRGLDNDKFPTENDGKVFEMSFSAEAASNDTPIVNVGKDQTVTLPASASLKSRVTDDARPASASLSWSKVSGPGDVTFSSPLKISTFASFSAVGTYVLKLDADDTEFASSDELTVTVQTAGTLEKLEAKVITSSDDAENKSDGTMELDGVDLDIAGPAVGIRFPSVSIPFEATIKSAYIQFTAKKISDNDSSTVISGQAIDNAPTFSDVDNDIISREKTSASIDWVIDDWIQAGDKGDSQRTPDISHIVQEIVNRDGWTSDNSLAFILDEGPGDRSAVSFDENPDNAPLLVIEFIIGKNEAPTVVAGTDQAIILADSVTLNANISDDNRPLPTNLTVKWSKVSGPGDVSFSDDSTSNTTANFAAIGIYTLKITADDGKLSTSDEIVIDVKEAKADQVITDFTATPEAKVVGDVATLAVTGNGGSGNAVTFASSTTDICTVGNNNTLTIVAVGTCTVTANQKGNSVFNDANQVSLDITTNKADQVISGFKLSPIAYVAGNSTGLSITSSGDSTNPVVYSSQTTDTCTVDNKTVSFIAAGSCTLAANQAGDAGYNVANEATLTINISNGNQAIPGDSTGDTIVNIQDIIATINRVLASEPIINGADCTLDAELDIRDIICTINIVLSNP